MIVDVCTYLFIFGISTFFFYIAEISYKSTRSKHSKQQRIIAACIAILIPCIFAAMRANTVGVDTGGYPAKHMEIAHSCESISAVFNDIDFESEYLYGFLVYVASRITSDAWPLLFLMQLLTILPVYLAAVQIKDKVNISYCMLTYFLIFYNNSLNLMRQSMSCAFVLYGFMKLLSEKKMSLKTFLVFVLAVLAHKSGLICLVAIALVLLASKVGKFFWRTVAYVAICFLPTLINMVYVYLLNLGVLSNKFIVYGETFLFHSGNYSNKWLINPFNIYSLTFVFILSTILIISIIGRRYSANRKSVVFDQINTINFCGFIMYLSILFGMSTIYGIRFSSYFDYFYVISLPAVTVGKNRKIKRLALIMILIMFWFIWVFINDWSGSSNYTLRF